MVSAVKVGDRLRRFLDQLAAGGKQLVGERDDGIREYVHRRIGSVGRGVAKHACTRRRFYRNAADRRPRDIGSYNRAMSDAADRSLLGGLTPAAFLRRHWQKRALLVRGAIPRLRGLVSRARAVPRSPAATTSNRGWCCARADAGRWRTDLSAPRISRRFRRADGRCWCRASICICPPATRCCAASPSSRTRDSTT